MSAREILAYAVTHAPKGVKGGPYEAGLAIGEQAPALRDATRWTCGRLPLPETLRAIRKVHPTARVIRIVRKARPSEPSAVEVLRDMLATWDARGIIRVDAFEAARRVLAASGPDPMPVVRAAMRETEAWDAYLAAPATRSRAETEVLDNASRKRFAAVDAYRKAGGK